ncbi:MAG: hypothetical protein Ta2A_03410 [Treponemataceae bacterium]|nr:MAG: hypothetical protein Ta2A_03410 [Treponemataceae bacterium]
MMFITVCAYAFGIFIWSCFFLSGFDNKFYFVLWAAQTIVGIAYCDGSFAMFLIVTTAFFCVFAYIMWQLMKIFAVFNLASLPYLLNNAARHVRPSENYYYEEHYTHNEYHDNRTQIQYHDNRTQISHKDNRRVQISDGAPGKSRIVNWRFDTDE